MAFHFEIAAERKILEAIEEGVFDNVPGKGLPLNLESDTGTPPELRAAHRILKNANAAPDWVQLNQGIREMLSDCSAQREKFRSQYQDYRARLDRTAACDGQRALRDFEIWYHDTITKLRMALRQANEDIQKYNLIAPTCTQTYIPFQVDEEIKRLTSDYPCPDRSVP